MFEFSVQTLRHWHLRLGRWHFRTWRSFFINLPRGYRNPEMIYQVVRWSDETDSIELALGAFDSASEARRLIEALEAEGRHGNLSMNYIPVHARVTDWEFDR